MSAKAQSDAAGFKSGLFMTTLNVSQHKLQHNSSGTSWFRRQAAPDTSIEHAFTSRVKNAAALHAKLTAQTQDLCNADTRLTELASGSNTCPATNVQRRQVTSNVS